MSKVWIIGGTSGIGEETAKYCAKLGDKVIATGKDTDVRHPDVLDSFYMMNNGFDCIVYSAGINELMWISKLNQSKAAEIYAVNTLGFMNTLQVISGNLGHVTHECHSLVAVSSDAAVRPMRTSIAYCASKAALDMAVRCAARELAPRVRVNAVAPGMIDGTEMTRYIDQMVPVIRNWTPDKTLEYEKSQVPMGRRGFKDEVAEVIWHTLHGPAYLTGAIIPVNGGR